jgi:putative phage-type endonuclease
MEQRTPEWIAERVGKVTASRVASIIARTKSGPSASRASYMGQLIAEWLTGTPMESFTSQAMQWGTDTEAEARAAYQFETGVLVAKVGFVPHPTIVMAGASPDGLIGETGLLEAKCPNTHTHVETLLGQSVPSQYITQMQFQMACTGRGWCDFVSYDPRMPEHMRLFIKRVHRDPDTIKMLEGEVIAFLAELDEKVSELTKRYGVKEAA